MILIWGHCSQVQQWGWQRPLAREYGAISWTRDYVSLSTKAPPRVAAVSNLEVNHRFQGPLRIKRIHERCLICQFKISNTNRPWNLQAEPGPYQTCPDHFQAGAEAPLLQIGQSEVFYSHRRKEERPTITDYIVSIPANANPTEINVGSNYTNKTSYVALRDLVMLTQQHIVNVSREKCRYSIALAPRCTDLTAQMLFLPRAQWWCPPLA